MGERSAEAQRQLELQLREQSEKREMQLTHNKSLQLDAVSKMGFKSAKSERMKYFLVWLGVHQKEKQRWTHKLARNAAVNRFASVTGMLSAKALLSSTFSAWQKDSFESKAASQMTLLTTEIASQREMITHFQEQLDQIMSTLQKELKTIGAPRRTSECLANEHATTRGDECFFGKEVEPLTKTAIYNSGDKCFFNSHSNPLA
jgi:hypothetical protein